MYHGGGINCNKKFIIIIFVLHTRTLKILISAFGKDPPYYREACTSGGGGAEMPPPSGTNMHTKSHYILFVSSF